jgi:hypothetical protein
MARDPHRKLPADDAEIAGWLCILKGEHEVVLCPCEHYRASDFVKNRTKVLFWQDAVHLFITEWVFDAIGQGEIHALELDESAIVESMIERVQALLK